MFVSFFIMILLPIFLITVISVTLYHSILMETITSRATTTLELVSSTVDNEVGRIKKTIASLLKDHEVSASISQILTAKDLLESPTYKQKLDQQLSNYFHHYGPDLISIVFFRKNQGAYYYQRNLNLNEKEIRQTPWYSEMLQSKNKVHLFDVQEQVFLADTDMKSSFTAVVAPGDDGPSFADIDLILFVFNDNILQQHLESQVSKSGELLVLNENASFIVSGNTEGYKGVFEDPYLLRAQKEEAGYYVAEINQKESFVVYLTSKLGWKYIRIIPYERFIKKVKGVYEQTIWIGSIGIIIFLLISVLIVSYIVKPILSLVKQMNVMKTGNLNVQIAERGPMEIFLLSKTFNQMVLRMKELILDVEEKERQKKHAEIAALQSQINPHFLLNTLNTIKLMAVMAKSQHIQKMTESLTKLLSFTFNRGGIYITIEEEIGLLGHYLNIMKVRYGDSFDVEIRVEERLKSFHILKLLLQPIIENAVIHGLQSAEGRGKLSITGEFLNEESLCFCIQDNGVGMSDAELGEIEPQYPKRESFNGMGLQNVHQRIQLNYGPKYGLKIVSKPGKGTKVDICLPLLEAPLNLDSGGD
ncbi:MULTISPECIES: sensor histidine kinase [unclassified Paenibacillus]|uniref:sensor histidine kinase n=1 Tax=unclassified Paenibacillus TaxID=185978 RepID=UPI0036451CF6